MPTTVFRDINLAHVAITVALGLAFILSVALRQRRASWKISTFFLGGRNIGAPLTAQAYWGSSFSFANGIIYFAVLGYLYGLSVIWFQLPWIIGIWILAWRLPQLIRITDEYTLHGFLGSMYGPNARIIASVVTITGFMGIFAYEVAISTEAIAGVLGITSGIAALALIVGIYVAAHADVGGFSGTARTDRIQNILGMIAVIVVIYYLVAFPNNLVDKEALSLTRIGKSFFDVSAIPWPIWLGVFCFAGFINIVDMSHWQAIAANSTASDNEVRRLQWAVFKSGWWMLFFPGATGAFIGYVWRGVQGITDANLMPATLAGIAGSSGELAGFVAGLVLLGLLAAGFSSASGYLLSSIQTLSWDLIHHRLIFRAGEKSLSDFEQQRIVLESRLVLYVFALASVVFFLVARHIVGDDKILPLQFVLVGIVVSLFPATAYGLWLSSRGLQAGVQASNIITGSIAAGFLAGTAVYFKPAIFGGDLNEVFQWAPVASLVISSIIAGIGIGRDVRRRSPAMIKPLPRSAAERGEEV